MAEVSFIRVIARLAPLLAPIPSAWFIGRSIYYHLLYQWHLPVNPLINLTVAIIAGLAIELLAISSVYLASSLYRWNQQGRVARDDGWEHAPFGLSLAVTLVYFLVAIYLLVVLEASPDLARFSAVAFPILAGVGAVNLALFQQHQDRLDRYGLKWSFKTTKEKKTQVAQKPEPARAPEYTPDSLDKTIMETLRTSPEASYSRVAAQVGASKSTVGARVLRLKEAHLVVPHGTALRVKWSGNGTSDGD